MAGIIYKHNNSLMSLTGSAYTQPNAGKGRFCIKNDDDTVKYGLTTRTSAQAYCKMAIRYNGQNYYIGRQESSASTVYTSSSTTISSSTSKNSYTSSSTEYNTSSSTTIYTTLTREYYEEQPKNSTGLSRVDYNAVSWDVKQTTGYERSVTVTYTQWKHTLSMYTGSGTQWAFQSGSSTSAKAASTSTKTSTCRSLQYSISSTASPNADFYPGVTTATYQQETGSRLHSTQTFGRARYTTAKPYTVASTVTFYTAMDSYTRYSVSTKSIIYNGTYTQSSFLGADGWRITSKDKMFGIKDSSLTAVRTFYQSAAGDKYSKPSGGWFLAETSILNSCSASRPRHTYTANVNALTQYGSREVATFSYNTTTSYWTETLTKYEYPVETTGSTSTWKTSSKEENYFTVSTSTEVESRKDYSYTTTYLSHNYV